jgi:hypothetical protein
MKFQCLASRTLNVQAGSIVGDEINLYGTISPAGELNLQRASKHSGKAPPAESAAWEDLFEAIARGAYFDPVSGRNQ